ncbi:hypothetical protein O3G_MSEX009877 [Manduca sexta]|uniref:Uncharacterized protein n=1 Tax=Manduca sexta TaxID=7130 RepID=A0A921ZF31_MANSE|nr:hypothetical protein O3G_MSEX009877 [Manduca sexta]
MLVWRIVRENLGSNRAYAYPRSIADERLESLVNLVVLLELRFSAAACCCNCHCCARCRFLSSRHGHVVQSTYSSRIFARYRLRQLGGGRRQEGF